MTTILLTPPPIPVALTADQVVAYLLRKGWRDVSIGPLPHTLWQKFRRDTFTVDVPLNPGLADHTALLTECIGKIARAESRPAERVASDIAGPAVGVGGVGFDQPTTSYDAEETRALCWIRMAPRRRHDPRVARVGVAAEREAVNIEDIPLSPADLHTRRPQNLVTSFPTLRLE